MKQRLTTPMLAAIGAMGLVCALFLSFYLSTGAYRGGGTGIMLPSQSQKMTVTTPDAAGDVQTASAVQVTAATVQKVIATLQRPTGYSYTLRSTIYADGATRSVLYRQQVRSGLCRTDELSDEGSIVRTVIRRNDTLYAWTAGSTEYYAGHWGDFSNDSAAMLPTYETVLKLPAAQIQSAALTNERYEPCIRVTASSGGYRILYDISTITGLLYRAEFYMGESKVRACQVTAVSTAAPADSVFVLPNGTELVSE